MGERRIGGVLDILMALTVLLLSTLSTVLVVVTVTGL
jgi:hypothetical protein